MTEPSEGARRAAEEINKRNRSRDHTWQNSLAANNVLKTQNDLIQTDEDATRIDDLAEIIDRETHSAEMRKALEKAEKTILSLQSTVRNFYQTRFGHLPPPPYFGDDDDTLNEIRAALKGGAL